MGAHRSRVHTAAVHSVSSSAPYRCAEQHSVCGSLDGPPSRVKLLCAARVSQGPLGQFRDHLRTVAETVEGTSMMLASGRLADFVACCGDVAISPEETATVGRETAALLGIEPGDRFLAMGR